MEHLDAQIGNVKKTLFSPLPKNKVEVFLRLSPTAEEPCITNVTDSTVKYNKDGTLIDFTFDKVFADTTSQEQIFRSVGLPLVDRLFKTEGSAVLFAYGATGSGKSFTIQGSNTEEGLLPRILASLFNSIPENLLVCPGHVKPRKPPKSEATAEWVDPAFKYSVVVSYFEIYNDSIYDLLATNPDKRRAGLRPKEDKNGSVVVQGLTEETVWDYRSARRWLDVGLKARNVKATDLNQDSSRSHSVFEAKLLKIPATRGNQISPQDLIISKLSIIDLAGSERAGKAHTTGDRLREASNINSSLTTLSRCIKALRTNQRLKPGQQPAVVPFRESKLTHLLRNNFTYQQEEDAAENNNKIVMMINVNPRITMADESLFVLKFGAVGMYFCETPTYKTAKTVTAQAAPSKHMTRAEPFALSANSSSNTSSHSLTLNEDEDKDLVVEEGIRPPEIFSPNSAPQLGFDLNQLLQEVDSMQAHIVSTEQRCITIEQEVREEMALELEMQLDEQELNLTKSFEMQAKEAQAYFMEQIRALREENEALTKECQDSQVIVGELEEINEKLLSDLAKANKIIEMKEKLSGELAKANKLLAMKDDHIASMKCLLEKAQATIKSQTDIIIELEAANTPDSDDSNEDDEDEDDEEEEETEKSPSVNGSRVFQKASKTSIKEESSEEQPERKLMNKMPKKTGPVSKKFLDTSSSEEEEEEEQGAKPRRGRVMRTQVKPTRTLAAGRSNAKSKTKSTSDSDEDNGEEDVKPQTAATRKRKLFLPLPSPKSNKKQKFTEDKENSNNGTTAKKTTLLYAPKGRGKK